MSEVYLSKNRKYLSKYHWARKRNLNSLNATFITLCIFSLPQGERSEWQVAFYVAAAVYYCGAIFYLVMADGEIQPWAEPPSDDTMDEQEEMAMGVGFGLHEMAKVEEEEEEEEATEKMLEKNGGAAKTVKA